MKKLTVSKLLMILPIAVMLGCMGYVCCQLYSAVNRGMLYEEADKTNENSDEWDGFNSNVNIMFTRPDDWRQIAKGPLLTPEEFAGIDGSTATIPITAELARQFGETDENQVRHLVHHNKTDAAYEYLIFGFDNWVRVNKSSGNEVCKAPVRLIFATPPSDEEYALANDNGAPIEVEPVALDGFVFITHKDNPVDSLTVEQIRGIYSGRITNWSEVGGRDEEIHAFQRTKNSGSQTAMEQLVMKGEPLADAPIAFVSREMGALVEAVAEYNNESAAIGYTYNYYINNLYKNPDIKVIAVDGIMPENDRLVSGEYPFTASYCVVIRADEPQDSVYRRLRDYMLTDEGQQIIELAGYCPIGG